MYNNNNNNCFSYTGGVLVYNAIGGGAGNGLPKQTHVVSYAFIISFSVFGSLWFITSGRMVFS